MSIDTRHAFGAVCSWHGSVAQTEPTGHLRVPSCPHCGGPLFEMPQAEWDTAVAAYATTHQDPDYVRFVAWLTARGRCSNLANGGYEAVRAEFDKLPPCQPSTPPSHSPPSDQG